MGRMMVLKYAKRLDLALDGEDPKPVYIATDLNHEEEDELVRLLREYRAVFAWSYKDLKGIDPEIFQHTIPLKFDANQVNNVPTLTMINCKTHQGRDRQTKRSKVYL